MLSAKISSLCSLPSLHRKLTRYAKVEFLYSINALKGSRLELRLCAMVFISRLSILLSLVRETDENADLGKTQHSTYKSDSKIDFRVPFLYFSVFGDCTFMITVHKISR